MQKVTFLTQPNGTCSGNIRVSGDKSISHRAIMFGSIAEGVTEVSGFLEGEDALATLRAFQALGVKIDGPTQGRVVIHGVGRLGLRAPAQALDLGNSGTSMRLLSGLMAGQAFDSVLTGDESLSKRPMRRVTEPLTMMGAELETEANGTAPIKIRGGQPLQGIHYTMPVASAQVKSCLLLAGLYAQGVTTVVEPAPTRDHTERMLNGFGYEVRRDGAVATLTGGGTLSACTVDVPSDISSAAFFIVAALIAQNADLTLQHVGMNPTRTGVIDILRAMGAKIDILNAREVGGEPVADLHVTSCRLHGIRIAEDLVPLAIDEFPVLFIAAACAEGKTILTGAEELRVKESDRIQVMADGLVACGIVAEATPDGIVIEGGQLQAGQVNSHGDHRIAMAFSVAGLCATGAIVIEDCANVSTSFPTFIALAQQVGMQVEQQVV